MMRFIPHLALVAALLLCSSCDLGFEKSTDEVRLGPENSFFTGGLDGGFFVLLKASEQGGNLYDGKIFHENGDLIYAGTFIYAFPDRTFDPSDPSAFAGWDGVRLHLSDDTYLTPTHPQNIR